MGGRGESNDRSGKVASRAEAISGQVEATSPPADRPVIDEAVTSLVAQLPSGGAIAEPIREFLRTSVAATLARRGVPANELRWPRMDVVIPAIEAMRYSQLGEAFSGLIASSMAARSAFSVLPAYVEILKQMGDDELKLLKTAPAIGRYVPIADIVYVLPNDQVVSAYRNVIPAETAKVCVFPRNIPQYIDNLVRLAILVRPLGQQADDVSYRRLARQRFVRDLMKSAPHSAKPGVDKAVIGLTDLGENFRRACIL